jgi:hypothetical protein
MRLLMMLALVACASPPPPPAVDPQPAPSPPPAVAADPPPAPVAADPAPATPADRMRPACGEANGAALVAVDRIKQGMQGAPDQKQTATIFDGGAWTMTDTVGGAPESGCVPDADLGRLRDELAKAPWQIQHAKFRCMMVSLVHTDYSVHGKLVWTEKVCSGETLDKASAAAIADVDAVMQKLDPNRQKI